MHTDAAATTADQPDHEAYTAPEVTAVTPVGDALIGVEFGSGMLRA